MFKLRGNLKISHQRLRRHLSDHSQCGLVDDDFAQAGPVFLNPVPSGWADHGWPLPCQTDRYLTCQKLKGVSDAFGLGPAFCEDGQGARAGPDSVGDVG